MHTRLRDHWFRRGPGRATACLLAAVWLGGCALLPANASNTPVEAVSDYIAKIAAHELRSARVCSQPYPYGYFKLLIGGIFAPVQALPGSDPDRTLSVINLDTSRLTIEESSRTGGKAIVDVKGTLVETFDPAEVEALFRAYAAEAGQAVELDLLKETVDNVSHGPVELDVRESVPVVLDDGEWAVCPSPYTP